MGTLLADLKSKSLAERREFYDEKMQEAENNQEREAIKRKCDMIETVCMAVRFDVVNEQLKAKLNDIESDDNEESNPLDYLFDDDEEEDESELEDFYNDLDIKEFGPKEERSKTLKLSDNIYFDPIAQQYCIGDETTVEEIEKINERLEFGPNNPVLCIGFDAKKLPAIQAITRSMAKAPIYIKFKGDNLTDEQTAANDWGEKYKSILEEKGFDLKKQPTLEDKHEASLKAFSQLSESNQRIMKEQLGDKHYHEMLNVEKSSKDHAGVLLKELAAKDKNTFVRGVPNPKNFNPGNTLSADFTGNKLAGYLNNNKYDMADQFIESIKQASTVFKDSAAQSKWLTQVSNKVEDRLTNKSDAAQEKFRNFKLDSLNAVPKPHHNHMQVNKQSNLEESTSTVNRGFSMGSSSYDS